MNSYVDEDTPLAYTLFKALSVNYNNLNVSNIFTRELLIESYFTTR